MKYHVNDRGEPGQCRAVIQCRFGTHYDTDVEARQAYESQHSSFGGQTPHLDPPLLRFPSVYHVGTLVHADRKTQSYEGDGVSVSLNPEDWQRIARLRGAVWELRGPSELVFAEYHGLGEGDRDKLNQWGLEQGWIKEDTAYAVTYWDDEWEQDFTLHFTSETEAQEEADACEVEIEKVTVLRPTESFPQARSDTDMTELLFTQYVKDCTAYDGVWWDDVHDVSRLSCPRGVLVRDISCYIAEQTSL